MDQFKDQCLCQIEKTEMKRSIELKILTIALFVSCALAGWSLLTFSKDIYKYTCQYCKPYIISYIEEIKNEEGKIIFSKD